MRSKGDTSPESTVDEPRGADQIPETVIAMALRASRGGHYSIMTNPDDRANGRMAITTADRLNGEDSRTKVRNVATLGTPANATMNDEGASPERTVFIETLLVALTYRIKTHAGLIVHGAARAISDRGRVVTSFGGGEVRVD